MVYPGDRFIKEADGSRVIVQSVEGDVSVCTKIVGFKVYKRPVRVPVRELEDKNLYNKGCYGS